MQITLSQAAQSLLDALAAAMPYAPHRAEFDIVADAADDLRAALAKQAEPIAIERLRDALVASRIIPPTAVEDPDEYDDGVTLYRIEALHRRLT